MRLFRLVALAGAVLATVVGASPATALHVERTLPDLSLWNRGMVQNAPWVAPGGTLSISLGPDMLPPQEQLDHDVWIADIATGREVPGAVADVHRYADQRLHVTLSTTIAAGMYRVAVPTVLQVDGAPSTTAGLTGYPAFQVLGADAATTETALIEAGGTWTSDASGTQPSVTLTFPEGVDGSVHVAWLDEASGSSLTSGFQVLGGVYEITVISDPPVPVTICLTYTEEQLAAAGLTEADLRLWHVMPGMTQDVTTTPASGGVICGTTSSYSPFFVGVPAPVEPVEERFRPLPPQARTPEGTPARGRDGGRARADLVRRR